MSMAGYTELASNNNQFGYIFVAGGSPDIIKQGSLVIRINDSLLSLTPNIGACHFTYIKYLYIIFLGVI